ncbi:MAG: CotS family spore coat protein [Firmicutes bacterium]|nr:CotS family spore coat protein [Bacillota bacterium]
MTDRFTVWFPPGSTPIVSQGVEAIPIGTPSPAFPVQRRARRRARSGAEHTRRDGHTGRVETPGGAGWKVPNQWQDLAASGTDAPGDGDTMAVPPEVAAMAQRAMALWSMKVGDMTVMATKPEKGGAIWRIETDRGPRSLKLLHRPAARSLFSVGLQDYLVKRKARVPALIPAKDGALSVELDGKLWIVTDWVEPLTPAGKGLDGAQALCYGLGEFHRWSQGYVPPAGAAKASRLYRWPKTYAKMLGKIAWFREIAQAYQEAPAAATVLSMTDHFAEQAQQAIARLERSPYGALTARGEPAWGVVHQDECGESATGNCLYRINYDCL